MRTLFGIMRAKTVLPGALLAGFAAGELAIAQLPPEIMADRYLIQAERELGNGDPAAAVEALNRIVALQAEHGLEIPVVFWFRRAEAAYAAGYTDLTLESVISYLERTGQDREHYVAALELYDAAELAEAEAAERAAEAAAREAALAQALVAAVPAATPEMAVIPAGQFRMGCVSGRDCANIQLPVHEVTISEPFAVS